MLMGLSHFHVVISELLTLERPYSIEILGLVSAFAVVREIIGTEEVRAFQIGFPPLGKRAEQPDLRFRCGAGHIRSASSVMDDTDRSHGLVATPAPGRRNAPSMGSARARRTVRGAGSRRGRRGSPARRARRRASSCCRRAAPCRPACMGGATGHQARAPGGVKAPVRLIVHPPPPITQPCPASCPRAQKAHRQVVSRFPAPAAAF